MTATRPKVEIKFGAEVNWSHRLVRKTNLKVWKRYNLHYAAEEAPGEGVFLGLRLVNNGSTGPKFEDSYEANAYYWVALVCSADGKTNPFYVSLAHLTSPLGVKDSRRPSASTCPYPWKPKGKQNANTK